MTDAAQGEPDQAVISAEDFRRFREFFYRRTGMHFESSKRYYVDRRIQEGMRRTDSDSFGEYFMYLRLDTSVVEFQTLVNSLTVNETYFFRERYQFECLVQDMLPEMCRDRSPHDPVRLWSMPCATGEEPYSLAIYLSEYWPGLEDFDVEILASDIDTDVLARARQGLYSARALHQLPAAFVGRYFERQPNGSYQLCAALRNSVKFSPINLSDRAQVRMLSNLDVVFCRNLLIYFDDLSRRQAAEAIFEALRPGGFVCLGHSESMSRISPLFKVRRFHDAIVYQKPF